MPTIAFWSPSPMELIIIGIVAILLFGRRLPEVARSLGRGLTEFKRGLRDEPTDTVTPTSTNRIEPPAAAAPPEPKPTTNGDPADRARPPE